MKTLTVTYTGKRDELNEQRLNNCIARCGLKLTSEEHYEIEHVMQYKIPEDIKN